MSLFTRFNNAYKWISGDPIITVLFLVAIFIPLPSIMPKFEGRLFPVVVDAKIEEVNKATDGNSLVKLTFTKKRDCDFKRISWSKIEEDGRLTSVFVNFLEDKDVGSKPTGDFRTGIWYIKMPSEVLRDYSDVEVRHSCQPMWDTRTHIYP